MIRTLALVLLGGCAGLSSSYATVYWRVHHGKVPGSDEKFVGLEYKKTRFINVPMIADGSVQGYIVAQFVYTAESHALKALTSPPDVYILDEAFRMIYANEKFDFRKLGKPDLGVLTQELKQRVAERMKNDVVKDILVQDFNYVSKDDIRK